MIEEYEREDKPPKGIRQWIRKVNGRKYRTRRFDKPDEDGDTWILQRKTPDGGGGDTEETIKLRTGTELFEKLQGFVPKGFVDKIRHHLKIEFLKLLAQDNEHVLSWLEERSDEITGIDFDFLTDLEGKLGTEENAGRGIPVRLELEFASHAAKFSFPWAGLRQAIKGRIREEADVALYNNDQKQRVLAEKQYKKYEGTQWETPQAAYLALDATNREKEELTSLVLQKILQTYSRYLLFVFAHGVPRPTK